VQGRADLLPQPTGSWSRAPLARTRHHGLLGQLSGVTAATISRANQGRSPPPPGSARPPHQRLHRPLPHTWESPCCVRQAGHLQTGTHLLGDAVDPGFLHRLPPQAHPTQPATHRGVDELVQRPVLGGLGAERRSGSARSSGGSVEFRGRSTCGLRRCLGCAEHAALGGVHGFGDTEAPSPQLVPEGEGRSQSSTAGEPGGWSTCASATRWAAAYATRLVSVLCGGV